MSAPHVLISIGPSHYCEKARWAMDRLGIAYREERHPPLLHLAATVPRRGRTTPILIASHRVLRDSSDILRFLDEGAPPALRLFPEDRRLADEVAELEDRFDEVLGPHVRRWAYAYLLEDETLTRAAVTAGVSRLERALFTWAQPLIVRAMKTGMRIDARAGERSLERIETIFREVDARLSDDRRFLVGERFSAADLTLCALAAPILDVPEYGAPLPALETVPGPMREAIMRFRETRTGSYVLRLYREERHPAPGPQSAMRSVTP